MRLRQLYQLLHQLGRKRVAAGIGVAWLIATPPAFAATLSAPTWLRRADAVAPPRASAFPVAGPFRIGLEAAQRFGGARDHKGQDVFARCGTPVVAARGGRVRRATFEGAGGHYVVVDLRGGGSEVYMHLRQAALVAVGDRVVAGQPLGEVGRTGNAWDCHLHFEIWSGEGWYAGGAPVDPYRRLAATTPTSASTQRSSN
jgi:murein DD-endopeptidase MepM/ murein hydrolase activator NlpD